MSKGASPIRTMKEVTTEALRSRSIRCLVRRKITDKILRTAIQAPPTHGARSRTELQTIGFVVSLLMCLIVEILMPRIVGKAP